MIARSRGVSLIAIMSAAVLAACGSAGAGRTTTRHATRTPPVTGTPSTVPSAPPAHAGQAPSPSPGGQAPLPGTGGRLIPEPRPTGIPARPADVAVIRAWSDALRHGDVQGAARYFALPSVLINGPDPSGNAVVTAIRTTAEAAAANAALPCGAKFISADQRGRYVNALFRLTDRPGPGGGCGGGVGLTARTNFVIANGRILEWIRAPDDPGDNPGSQAPPPAAPGTQQSPGPTV